MMDEDPMVAYRQRLDDVRGALANRQRWHQMPQLLDQLDGARRRVRAWRSQQAWIGCFSAAVQARGTTAAPESVRRAGCELWPWLGWFDPEAVGAGQWDQLPRSHP